MNLLNLINPSLSNVYCSTILLNYSAIRLKGFVLQFTRELNCAISFFCPYLIFHACVQTFDVTFLTKIFWELNKSKPGNLLLYDEQCELLVLGNQVQPLRETA